MQKTESLGTKENLLNRRVSRAGAEAPRLSGSNDSGDGTTIANQRVQGKASADQVADELQRLLMLKTGQPDGPMYSRGGNTGGPTLLPLRKPKGYGSVNEANGASHREALRHKRVA